MEDTYLVWHLDLRARRTTAGKSLWTSHINLANFQIVSQGKIRAGVGQFGTLPQSVEGLELAVSRRLGDEIHPWPPNGGLRPGPAVHGRYHECRLSDREPVVQLQRSVRLLIASGS